MSDDFGRTWTARASSRWSSEAGIDAGVGEARLPRRVLERHGAWQFGHPRGVLLPGGEVFPVWYGGTGVTRPARWARVALDPA
ncbi:MAG: hypothetical protein U0869_04725 [Chloroflexota bacterium]